MSPSWRSGPSWPGRPARAGPSGAGRAELAPSGEVRPNCGQKCGRFGCRASRSPRSPMHPVGVSGSHPVTAPGVLTGRAGSCGVSSSRGTGAPSSSTSPGSDRGRAGRHGRPQPLAQAWGGLYWPVAAITEAWITTGVLRPRLQNVTNFPLTGQCCRFRTGASAGLGCCGRSPRRSWR